MVRVFKRFRQNEPGFLPAVASLFADGLDVLICFQRVGLA
jgi:hypothetical protein